MIGRRVQEIEDRYVCKVVVILVDPANEGGIRKLSVSLEGREVHVLANNAGFGFGTLFSDTGIDRLKRLIYLRTAAMVEMAHHVLKGVKERSKGIIINISSDGALAVVPGNVTYAASKRLIATLTEGLHMELISAEIRVQVVCPGSMDTDFHENNRMHTDKTRKGMSGLQQSEDMADEAIRELEKGKIIRIPDKVGKLVRAAVEYMPRRIYYWLINDFVNKNIRKN